MGRVGEVDEVDAQPIEDLCLAGVVPVLPSLAEDADGRLLNVNADTAAAAVATSGTEGRQARLSRPIRPGSSAIGTNPTP